MPDCAGPGGPERPRSGRVAPGGSAFLRLQPSADRPQWDGQMLTPFQLSPGTQVHFLGLRSCLPARSSGGAVITSLAALGLLWASGGLPSRTSGPSALPGFPSSALCPTSAKLSPTQFPVWGHQLWGCQTRVLKGSEATLWPERIPCIVPPPSAPSWVLLSLAPWHAGEQCLPWEAVGYLQLTWPEASGFSQVLGTGDRQTV